MVVILHTTMEVIKLCGVHKHLVQDLCIELGMPTILFFLVYMSLSLSVEFYLALHKEKDQV